MTFSEAQIACHRFGLGAKPNEINQATQMGGKDFLLNQLNRYEKSPKLIAALASSNYIIKDIEDRRRSAKKSFKGDISKLKDAQKKIKAHIRTSYIKAVLTRHKQATLTAESFNERLVYFWQNHFAISAEKINVKALAASFENEAIRQHVMGNFSDMLVAVAKHPAMQIFLDNFKSIGPNSRIGKKRKKGLNENLAREILELHTLGVDNGYSQQDIIAFANMLTGWSVGYKKRIGFIFNKSAHEPKSANFMGKKYAQKNIGQAIAAMDFLAVHKNTAAYIAQKLTQHFAGNKNPKTTKDLTNKLTQSFIKTGGQLKPLYKILIHHSACWANEPLRFRTPNEWVIATTRAAQNFKLKPKALNNGLKNMGQPPYFPGSPAGWPDQDKHWNSPSAFVQKWQHAKLLAKAISQTPKDYVIICLGENVDEHTVLAMRKAKTKHSALTLFLLSEQMQFR